MTIEVSGMAPLLQAFDMSASLRLYPDVLRFSSLRRANGTDGRPFRELALESGHHEVVELFGPDHSA
jgi:hypothetical protein